MSETQIIKKLTPTVKVSSMDGHRMLTHPAAAPARAGTQAPRRTGNLGGQPIKQQEANVAFRTAPMEAIMGGGGVIVKHPTPHPRAPAPMTLSAPVPVAQAPTLTAEQAGFLASVLHAHMMERQALGHLSGPEAAPELELARGALAALAHLAPAAVIDAALTRRSVDKVE